MEKRHPNDKYFLHKLEINILFEHELCFSCLSNVLAGADESMSCSIFNIN